LARLTDLVGTTLGDVNNGDMGNDPMAKLVLKFLVSQFHLNCTLWLFNIAMENGPFIDGLPIENGDFPWLC